MHIGTLVQKIKALADEGRLLIFAVLAKRESCVCELSAITRFDQPRVSQQLKLLRFAGLVDSRREGKWTVYFIPDSIRNDRFYESLLERTTIPSNVLDRIKIVEESDVRNSGTAVLADIIEETG